MVNVAHVLVAPPKFNVCNKLPPLISTVPEAVKLPAKVTVLVVVPLNKSVPLIVETPVTFAVVMVVPKSKVLLALLTVKKPLTVKDVLALAPPTTLANKTPVLLIYKLLYTGVAEIS